MEFVSSILPSSSVQLLTSALQFPFLSFLRALIPCIFFDVEGFCPIIFILRNLAIVFLISYCICFLISAFPLPVIIAA